MVHEVEWEGGVQAANEEGRRVERRRGWTAIRTLSGDARRMAATFLSEVAVTGGMADEGDPG